MSQHRINQTTTTKHFYYMKQALALAAQGVYTVDPNPMVGAIIVRDQQILGQGYHQKAGEAHAEVLAINDALSRHQSLKGATLYVTLEPCSHTGRTPPCCQAIEAHDFALIVVACQDPNPLVAGQGITRLQHRFKVLVGIGSEQAQALNIKFIHRMTTGKPWVSIKIAASLDGKTALHNGHSQWITGTEARNDVHRLRLASSAVLTGRETMIKDQALLNAREDRLGFVPTRQPVRVILDCQGKTLPLVKQQIRNKLAPGQHTLLCTSFDHAMVSLSQLEVLPMPLSQNRIDLEHLLTIMGNKGFNSVLVESGPTLAGAMLTAKKVDEIIVYLAPSFLGPDARPMLQLPLIERLPELHEWYFHQFERVGQDLKIVLRQQSFISTNSRSEAL